MIGSHCTQCIINKRKSDLSPDVGFDDEAYREMVRKSKDLRSLCCITGRSLFALRKVGEQLSIDRIDPTKGYVRGNMQLMALDLNAAKGTNDRVPKAATNRLLRKLTRVVDDTLSSHDGAVQES